MFSASILIYWLRGDGPFRETQKEEGEEGEEVEEVEEVACCFFARRRAAVRGAETGLGNEAMGGAPTSTALSGR